MTVKQRKARKIPLIMAIPLWILYLVLEGFDKYKNGIKVVISLLTICLLMLMIVKFLPFAERIPVTTSQEQVQLQQQEQIQETTVLPQTTNLVEPKTKETMQTTVMEKLKQMVVVEETEKEEEETVVNTWEQQSNTAFFSEEDEFFLKSVAYAEAGVDGKEAVKAVMHVLYNRTKAEGFGSSIREVVNKSGAFSSVRGGYVYLVTSEGNILVTQDILPTYVNEAYETFVAEVQAGIDPTKELLQEQANLLGFEEPKFWQDGALYFYNPYAISWNEQNARASIRVQIPIGSQYFYCYWG